MVWPSIEGIAWRNEEPIADIVAKLAARRTPVEDTERMIEDFARSQGEGKTKKLIAVFAGLFETLNDERTQVIEGLLRFGAKQKELADKIRAENALAREGPGKKPDTSEQDAKTVAQDLEWTCAFSMNGVSRSLMFAKRRRLSSKDCSRSPKSFNAIWNERTVTRSLPGNRAAALFIESGGRCSHREEGRHRSSKYG